MPPSLNAGARLSRRTFLRGTALGAGAVLAGCGAAPSSRTTPIPAAPGADGAGFHAGSATRLPLIVATGTAYEIGRTVGQRFAAEIRDGLAARGAWFRDLKAFAATLPRAALDTFVAAAQRHTPAAWDDLRGLADGSGVPLRDLLVRNLAAELAALRASKPAATCEVSPGCSTVVLDHGGRVLVVHNEDGDAAYLGRMFMLRARPTGQPAYLCASYPGVLPGNAPWINDRGVIMTTNFIHTKEVKLGVGRYFLDREAIGAGDLDAALRICRHPDRAYAFHHVLASTRTRRVVSLEVTPSRDSLLELKGLFLHTNHLVHAALAGEAQDEQYVGTSSLSRWRVLTAWRASLADPTAVTPADILRILASHERRPYSPCRHPMADVRGATLLTAVFDVARPAVRIYRDQPCRGRATDYELPGRERDR